MSLTCHKCGASVLEQKAFCPNCGASMSQRPKSDDEPLPNLAATVVGQKFPVLPPATPPVPKPPPASPSIADRPAPPPASSGAPARAPIMPATAPPAAAATMPTAPPARKNTTLFIILGLVAVILIGAILMLVALALLAR